MEKPHIYILSTNTTNNETLYTILKVSENSSEFIRQGVNKNGIYQVAHRVARQSNLPLYVQTYQVTFDNNGVKHLVPIKKKEVAVSNKENISLDTVEENTTTA